MKGNHNERDLKLHKIPDAYAYASWLDADVSVVSVVLSIDVSKRCCVLCITYTLVVGDHVLFNVNMC